MDEKQPRKSGDTVFQIITLSVTMKTSGLNLVEFQTRPRSHVCNHYLQVWKGFDLRTAEKKWRHRFSHYKPMGIFSDVQGQLTPQSVVPAGRNSNSSELSCMLSLPASMKRIGWKNCEKKWRHRFSQLQPLWELSVAMETRVLIRSDPKPNAAFPPTQWCFR